MVGGLWYALAAAGAVVGVVLALFLHELAHAIPLLLAGYGAHVTIGSDRGRTVEVGRLSVTVGFDGIATLLSYGYYQPRGSPSTRVQAIATLAGPVATLALVGVIGVVLYLGVPEPLWWALLGVGVHEANRAVQTAVPKTYSGGPYDGWDSDGKRFLELVRA